jgi:signal transduction histidine kinase
MEPLSSDAGPALRTLLTRIRGELDLVLRSGVPDPPRSQLEWIQEQLERLSRVCGRLLLLARLDQRARNASVLDERVDLEQVVSELLEQMAPVAQDRGVALGHGASSTLHVRGSRPLLVEALLNLLDNAIRATPAGGAVIVSIDASGDSVRLSVQDGGPGVPPEERERIFLPFYRIPRASGEAADEGSGLGPMPVS